MILKIRDIFPWTSSLVGHWLQKVPNQNLPTIIHQIVGNFLEPKIFGESFGLHPITIILSLIFWGMIWGFIGVLLAAPLTAIIRITFERFQTTRQIARLLEGKIHIKEN